MPGSCYTKETGKVKLTHDKCIISSGSIVHFRLRQNTFRNTNLNELESLCGKLMNDYQLKSELKEKTSKLTGDIVYQEFYPRLSKKILDEIDFVLARHYNFTEEELDFIINYDIKYRMGREGNNDGGESE